MSERAACADTIKAMARCLHESDCIKNGQTVSQCFNGNDVPECEVRLHCLNRFSWVPHDVAQKYRKAFFECKRGQLDMRTR